MTAKQSETTNQMPTDQMTAADQMTASKQDTVAEQVATTTTTTTDHAEQSETKPATTNQAATSKRVPEDGWNPELNQDEAILAQEREIEREIAQNSALIGDRVNLQILLNEYNTDKAFVAKIPDLLKTYGLMRRTRPDGNCFFRGLCFAYFELLLDDEQELRRFLNVIEECRKMLIEVGFSSFTIEDFHDTFVGVLQRIASKDITTITQLLEVFNEPGMSNYLVVYLRLITSGHLQKNYEFYQHFIEGHASVKDFCSHEVEPMYKESDHIHITAITEATGISVCINYLNRGDGEQVTKHNFPDHLEPKIFLLYRPGHYDVLYKNDSI